jgi:hypothetical protein
MFAAALVGASAASAQQANSLGPQPAELEEGTSTGDVARRAMNVFAACVLHRHTRQAEDWLSLAPGDPAAAKKLANLMDEKCLYDGQLQFSTMLFRGSLYAALYRVQFGHRPPALSPASGAGGSAGSFGSLSEFANCVVRRDPSTARTLVLATAGSTQEGGALSGLSPQFPLCLAKGSQLRLSKAVMISLLDEALYRDSAAAPGAVTAGTSR